MFYLCYDLYMTHFCENVIIGLLCSPEHSTSPYRFWIGLISFPVAVISLRKVAPLLRVKNYLGVFTWGVSLSPVQRRKFLKKKFKFSVKMPSKMVKLVFLRIYRFRFPLLLFPSPAIVFPTNMRLTCER